MSRVVCVGVTRNAAPWSAGAPARMTSGRRAGSLLRRRNVESARPKPACSYPAGALMLSVVTALLTGETQRPRRRCALPKAPVKPQPREVPHCSRPTRPMPVRVAEQSMLLPQIHCDVGDAPVAAKTGSMTTPVPSPPLAMTYALPWSSLRNASWSPSPRMVCEAGVCTATMGVLERN